MATMEVSVTQEMSEPKEDIEKEARDDVPKPEALNSPAPRTDVETGKEDPGHTSASIWDFSFACF